jgi:hypothetical protein
MCDCAREIYELNECSFCRPLNEPRPYYCDRYCSDESCDHSYDCTNEDHATCWDSHFPLKLAKQHKKIDVFSNLYVNYVTYSESIPEQQVLLHERDRIAKWFIVQLGSGPQATPSICISNRFRQLCPLGNRSNSKQYPSFVSFIGDTGVGKSTLIRAMILMGRVDALGLGRLAEDNDSATSRASSREEVTALGNILDHHGPVTRSANPEYLTDPTTSGVHLYRDPTNSNRQYSDGQVPLLFADCEGFGAERAVSNSERTYDVAPSGLSFNRESGPRSRSSSPRNPRYDARLDVNQFIDKIPITSPEYRGKGKLGAELLYARFLYAFSDVVVFVTKADQLIHSDMRRLLEWAALAVDSSINHRPQKTLIVARNMPPKHDEKFYNGSYLKRILLGGIQQKLWEDSPILASFKEKHDKRSKLTQDCIHSNEQLFGALFQQTKVCYIPQKDLANPAEVFAQYRSLRRLIVYGTDAAQKARGESWTRYDAPTLAHLLNRAFNHFAAQQTPFDFYKAARKDNPTPVSMAEHIANFIRHMQERKGAPDEIPTIITAGFIAYAHREFNWGE